MVPAPEQQSASDPGGHGNKNPFGVTWRDGITGTGSADFHNCSFIPVTKSQTNPVKPLSSPSRATRGLSIELRRFLSSWVKMELSVADSGMLDSELESFLLAWQLLVYVPFCKSHGDF